MAEIEPTPEQEAFAEWLEGLDLETPIFVSGELPDPPSFAPEELERLQDLGREYAQELFDRDAIPDVPPLDMDTHLLEPEPHRDLEIDR